MSSKLNELVNKFNESDAKLDGKNDYAIVTSFLQAEGIRANNAQTWKFIDEVKNSAGEAADW